MAPPLIISSSHGGKLPVSCFIIAKNEAHRIARCISSVIEWVDEVIVVEANSSDDTVEVAKCAGARVIHHEWEGFGQQKRFAEDQCRNAWVLNLDADEVATPALKAELTAILSSGDPEFAAYQLDVQIVYPGWEKPRLWARDHKCIRYYDRTRVRFRDSAIHDSVEPGDLPVGRLSGALWHHTFTSMNDLIAKCDERASFGALHSSPRSAAMLQVRSLIEWPLVFAKYYFVRRHFTGGEIGLRYCNVIATYRRKRILRMLELAATKRDASETDVIDIADRRSGPDVMIKVAKNASSLSECSRHIEIAA